MSEPVSISTGIASRYATAVFELAKESKALKSLETDIVTLASTLEDSVDLRQFITSPLYSRDQQQNTINTIAAKMKLSSIVTNTLSLMASKRRLFVLPQLVECLQKLISDEKGEITAEVVSAKALTKAQQDKLSKALKANAGKNVNLNLTVDESLIGGLVVKLGSKMIDTSIRSKLNSLQNSMKEVG